MGKKKNRNKKGEGFWIKGRALAAGE